MTEKDKEAFEIIMTSIAEVCDADWNDKKADLYFATFQDLSLEDFNRAANLVMKTYPYKGKMPMPVVFTEALNEGSELRAAEAYTKLDEAWKRLGSYRTVIFDDPVIHMALYAWGGDEAWIKLNDLKTDEVVWFRKDFEKYYQMYAGKEIRPPQKLMGITEKQNVFDGHQDFNQPPSLVGEEKKALGWSRQKQLKDGRNDNV